MNEHRDEVQQKREKRPEYSDRFRFHYGFKRLEVAGRRVYFELPELRWALTAEDRDPTFGARPVLPHPIQAVIAQLRRAAPRPPP